MPYPNRHDGTGEIPRSRQFEVVGPLRCGRRYIACIHRGEYYGTYRSYHLGWPQVISFRPYLQRTSAIKLLEHILTPHILCKVFSFSPLYSPS